MSFLYCQGPVVYPRSPALETKAKMGCHASNGRVVDGGSGFSCIHFFPNTAVGRNRIPSSAMKAAKASRVPFSSDMRANERSVSIIDLRSLTPVFFCAAVDQPKKQTTSRSSNRLLSFILQAGSG